MKKFLVVLVLVLLCIFTFVACSGGDDGDSATDDAAAADYPTAENPITLKAACFMPEAESIGKGYALAAETVEELTGGAVIVDVYYDGTLLSFGDTFQGVSTGVADLGLMGCAAIDGSLVLNQIYGTMHKGMPADIFDITDCYYKLWEEFPEVRGELDAFNMDWISIQGLPGASFILNDPIKTVDDIKGKTLQCIGECATYFASLGASTVALDVADYYVSLERGVVDGEYDSWTAFVGFGMVDLGKHFTIFDNGGLSGGGVATLANKDSLAKLSPEQLDALRQGFKTGTELTLSEFDAQGQAGKDAAAANGAEIYTITGADLEAFYAAVDPIVAAWIEKVEAAGWPGQEVYDRTQEMFDEFNK